MVAVQNHYNVVSRRDDDLIDWCARQGIAYVPFYPLGGFRPLEIDALDAVARDLGITARQTALAWLLQRSPNTLLIPGTSSPAHLRENIAAADVTLPASALRVLDTLTPRPRRLR